MPPPPRRVVSGRSGSPPFAKASQTCRPVACLAAQRIGKHASRPMAPRTSTAHTGGTRVAPPRRTAISPTSAPAIASRASTAGGTPSRRRASNGAWPSAAASKSATRSRCCQARAARAITVRRATVASLRFRHPLRQRRHNQLVNSFNADEHVCTEYAQGRSRASREPTAKLG